MKKLIALLSAFVMIVGCFAACGTADDEQKFTVTYSIDGQLTTEEVVSGEKATKEDPVKSGYIFSGWYEKEDCSGEKIILSAYPITKDVTLYAGWKEIPAPKSYTVSFDLAGGNVANPIPNQSVTEGGKAECPEAVPAKEGYIFVGWYNGGKLYDFEQAVQANVALVAEYKVALPVTEGSVTATSEADGHLAQLALDGDVDTYWIATQETASLTIDLKEINEIRSVRQIFNDDAAWAFTIDASVDGKNWAEIATNEAGLEEKADYKFTANGYFRYVRLNVTGGKTPSSKEFYVEVFDAKAGTNVALGMKGSASNWAGGYETEKAFDGKYDTFWCANDGGFPQFLAVEWTYTVYVETIEFTFANEGTHNYEVEARIEDGTWIKLSEASDHVGQTFKQQVKREVNAVLIREFAGPGWANVVEFNVYGFKNVAAFTQKTTADEYDVYELGESFIRGVVTQSETVEYSVDGEEWNSLTAGYETANVNAKFVRVQKDQTAKIFATQYKTDLARYIEPTVSDYSNEEYRGAVATMNPENVWAAERFWCAASAGGEHTFELDFGRNCIVEGFRYEFQDNRADNGYKLRIQLSTDKENWVSVYDTFENGASGKVFAMNFAAVSARYVKITVESVNAWTNCKNLQIYGVGAPVRPIEIR